VLTLNGGQTQALRCLEGLALQADAPEHEVIVVDNASVDLQPLLSRLDGDVEVVRSDRRLDLPAAIALGVDRARGEVVVLLRDAAAPAAGWLAPLVAALDDTAVGLAASVTAGQPAGHPVSALAVAVRAGDLDVSALAGAPEAAFAALSVAVARAGLDVTAVPASLVQAPGAVSGESSLAPGTKAELTIVIPTLDSTSERVRATVAAARAATAVAHEIVIVDNGSPPQGFAGPANAGIRAADTPYIVLMNDDVELLPGWWAPLRAAIDAGAAVAYPATIDGGMRPDFAPWCFAIAARSLPEISHGPGELFDPSMVIWFQDTDLLLRLGMAGRPPVLAPDSHIRHGLSVTVASEDPTLKAWIRQQILADRERMLAKHPQVELRPLSWV
jgi:GT2 family glycosyltransferase